MEASPWYHQSDDPPFDRKVLRTIFTVLAVVVSIWLIIQLWTPLLWLIVAVFVAIAASGPVNFLSKYMKRGFAITLTYLMILLVPLGLSAALLPPLVTSAIDLVDQMPQYINDFQATLEGNKQFQRFDENFDVNQQLTNLAADLSGKLGDAASTLGDIGTALINSIFASFTILVLSLFMVARGRKWIDEWLETRAGPEADALGRTVDRIGGAVGNYIGGAIAQSFLAGLAAFIVLSILGVPSPLVLAVIVAAFDFVPMVGSTIAGLLVGTVTLFADFPLDTIVWAIFVIGYQQFENYVIQPRIQSRAVEMEPFVILVAVLFGGTLMGVVGAILAIPIAATLQITYQEFNRFKAEIRAMTGDNAVLDPAVAAGADEPMGAEGTD